jgi:hypothetical protein
MHSAHKHLSFRQNIFTCLLKIHCYVAIQNDYKITVLECLEGIIYIKSVCVVIYVCIEILFLYKIKINLISIVNFLK